MTTNQARDKAIECMPLTTSNVRELKNMAKSAEDERKLDGEVYVKCPRCYAHHSIHGNFDNLCDQCQKTILQHFPNHASVSHIKSAIGKWFTNQHP